MAVQETGCWGNTDRRSGTDLRVCGVWAALCLRQSGGGRAGYPLPRPRICGAFLGNHLIRRRPGDVQSAHPLCILVVYCQHQIRMDACRISEALLKKNLCLCQPTTACIRVSHQPDVRPKNTKDYYLTEIRAIAATCWSSA